MMLHNLHNEMSHILVVDDNPDIRDMLGMFLRQNGYRYTAASNGLEALELLTRQNFDLILLDIMMPHMDGFGVLAEIYHDQNLRRIPVVMLTAVDDMDSIIRCVELGAEDYLFKPFNQTLLRARIQASLEKKYLNDIEKAQRLALEMEQAKTQNLLLNIMPAAIAERLKAGENVIADYYEDVTVLFADLVGFTPLAASIAPEELVEILNGIFHTFDQLVEVYGLEKIKTVGDSYMVVGGIPTYIPDHCARVADMALAMQAAMRDYLPPGHTPMQLRIGMDRGPVVAGVIGRKKVAYDLWGDTVNTANRMESEGVNGQIQVTAAVYHLLRERYRFEPRGEVPIKGKGAMQTYFLIG